MMIRRLWGGNLFLLACISDNRCAIVGLQLVSIIVCPPYPPLLQVKCQDCQYESNTYDPILDISLEISRAASVEKALQRYTTGEVLDGSNKYKCPKQKKFVRAVKRITIEV